MKAVSIWAALDRRNNFAIRFTLKSVKKSSTHWAASIKIYKKVSHTCGSLKRWTMDTTAGATIIGNAIFEAVDGLEGARPKTRLHQVLEAVIAHILQLISVV